MKKKGKRASALDELNIDKKRRLSGGFLRKPSVEYDANVEAQLRLA